MSLADIKRNWLLKQLGISSSTLSETDLLNQLYSSTSAPVSSKSLSPYKSGFWYTGIHNQVGASAVADGQLRGLPFIPGRDLTVNRMAIDVTVAGTAGAVVRLGIYEDTDDGNISLVRDAGTVVSTAVATPELAIPDTVLSAGKLYWLVAVPQGAPATPGTLRTATNGTAVNIGGDSASIVLSNALVGLQISGIAGALPASLSKVYTTGPIKVAVKVV